MKFLASMIRWKFFVPVVVVVAAIIAVIWALRTLI